MIDIVIPTLWVPKEIVERIHSYLTVPYVNRVIVVDNCPQQRPESLVSHPKLEIVSYGRNIFVNPAWNEGYSRSTSDVIALINDDISVDSSVFQMVGEFNPKPGDLIGVNLQGRQNNYLIDEKIDTAEEIVQIDYNPTQPIGGQAWAFGICMFMHRNTYKQIPSLYQVWYGDDYLAQNADRVYAINSDRIKGKISETLEHFRDPNGDITKRIELDSKNLQKFNHFQNAKNWDIPKNIVAKISNDRKMLASDPFDREYQWARSNPSDINENVHILYDLANQCKRVVEFGVRTGVSTRAFLKSGVSLRSYDIEHNAGVQQLFDIAKTIGRDVEYTIADVLKVEIEPTDLLFIDTFHIYDQLKQELALHSLKVKKYIAFHDTHTFGLTGEDPLRLGLLPAIIEFLIEHPEWRFHTHLTNNNGMTVLERIN